MRVKIERLGAGGGLWGRGCGVVVGVRVRVRVADRIMAVLPALPKRIASPGSSTSSMATQCARHDPSESFCGWICGEARAGLSWWVS